MTKLFRKENNRLQCLLCPHYCKIAEGMTGICGVRKNNNNKIELLTYGVVSGYGPDPIEKKPLYHFYPGTNIFSVGSYGCNMRCDFCQNYNISQHTLPDYHSKIEPDKIISDALSTLNNTGIAFTYNEPVIWFEFIRDLAAKAKNYGLHIVLVSNGYVNKEPLDEIISFTDAFNIDLKAFNDEFYRRLTGAEIEPVKNTLKQIARSGKHLELTTLIIPGYNDSEKEMAGEAEWIAGELGKETPLHLSRYFPMYKRDDQATSVDSLIRLADIASGYLSYVYAGNMISDHYQNTKCPGCGKVVTRRRGYHVTAENLDRDGNCLTCGTPVYRHFTSFPSSLKN